MWMPFPANTAVQASIKALEQPEDYFRINFARSISLALTSRGIFRLSPVLFVLVSIVTVTLALVSS